jgi:hypothetical protein
VQGCVHCDRVDSRLGPLIVAAGHRDAAHYWVELDGVIYDISADQFNYRLDDQGFPPVVIAAAADLPHHHALAKAAPVVPDDGDWAAAFARERARVAADVRPQRDSSA